MFLLSTLTQNTNNLELIVYEIIVGIGAGLANANIYYCSSKCGCKKRVRGCNFIFNVFEQLGSVIGLAVLGTIVNMTLNFNLQNTTLHVSSSLLVTAIHNVFVIAVILNIIGLILCLFLKDIYMSNEMEVEEIGFEDAPGEI